MEAAKAAPAMTRQANDARIFFNIAISLLASET